MFDCTAKDGFMAYEDAGKLLELVSSSEALEIVNRFDADDDDAVSEAEYVGLPVPRTHIIGTDQLGRDLLSRTVYGARISLAVGFLATFVSFIIGVSWGATAGYFGGKVDNIMMRIVDIMYGLPFMFLVILLMVVFGQKIFLLFLALGAIQWLTMARIVRGQVISLKNQEFVEAARTIGVSPVGIIFKHLIPNALGPIIVYATLTVPAVMLEEAFLSFLGLGVQAPQTSWGALISEGRQLMESAPWLIVYPGLALAVTLLALNFLGDGLRDALDPQLRKD
ncbi:ABC transporter permease [Microvenator marinus]|uniref:ABC transporter permease n=1 Tax=Microvenator marinus TaxID=2600177 RepID=UPI003D31B31F